MTDCLFLRDSTKDKDGHAGEVEGEELQATYWSPELGPRSPSEAAEG